VKSCDTKANRFGTLGPTYVMQEIHNRRMSLIDVTGLRKNYGAKEVLTGIDLRVEAGEIVGILGPNGSGKTTTVECIGGLRAPDGGTISVDGIDPQANESDLRGILGMQLQEARLPAKITTAEAINLFGSFYPDPEPTDVLLERLGIGTQRDERFENLSGGQQQRLSVALALVGRPRVAILDELTTGLDPAARRDIWTYLGQLREAGTTFLLVTHSMEEAQHLCDRVYILADGRFVRTGSPDDLSSAAGTQMMSFLPSTSVNLEVLRSLHGVHTVREDGPRVVVEGDDGAPQTVLALLSAQSVTVRGVSITTPTLEDAYLAATRGGPST
jgi:ABC-2 type transport system ATP-binding protein